MKKRLRHIPFFVLLLPAFFVFHGYVAYYGYIQPRYCLELLGSYLLATAVIYLLLYALYRETAAPAFLTAYLMGFNFCFGALQDLLAADFPALNRYRILFPFFFLLGILLAVSLRKGPKKWSRPTLFLNVLLLLWMLADGVLLVSAMGRPRAHGLSVMEPPLGKDRMGNEERTTDKGRMSDTGRTSGANRTSDADRMSGADRMRDRDRASDTDRTRDRDQMVNKDQTMGHEDHMEKRDLMNNKQRDPDIYFLLFDEYASTAALKKYFGYDNAGLDDWLRQEAFHIQQNSHSNYNETPLSMASILNISYLGWAGPAGICSEEDYTSCERLIRDNRVTEFLSARGYSIINYSQFDLAHHPAIVRQRTLPLRSRLIEEATFVYRIQNELGWHHYERWPFLQWFLHHIPYETLENNQVLLEKTQTESTLPHVAPVFVYTHLEMPHAPFVFTEEGRLKSPGEMTASGFGEPVSAYTGYLSYTNQQLKKLIRDIRQNTQNKAVIILMGDHGFRREIPGEGHLHYFQNLNAVYFPGEDYHLLYDSISGVNQFRVVFNHLFDQHWPMLPDSTLFVTDKK